MGHRELPIDDLKMMRVYTNVGGGEVGREDVSGACAGSALGSAGRTSRPSSPRSLPPLPLLLSLSLSASVRLGSPSVSR